jgi:Zn-dependent protease with chaperone function
VDRRKLTGLRPQSYEHPLDMRALNVLENTPGLRALIKKVNEYGLERLLRIQYTGSNLCVNADNFPEVYEKVDEACKILDVPIRPDVYITAEGNINAMMAGVEHPLLALTSAAIDQLTDDELLFVIGHEIGHMKSGHILYYQMAQYFHIIAARIDKATLGMGSLLSTPIQIALLNWKRTSEFTSDRAGLLVCQDANVAIGAMIKLAGLPRKYFGKFNADDFIAQAKDFAGLDESRLDWIAKAVSIMGQSHPWTVMRASEFLRWIDSGEYERVLKMPHGTPALPPPITAVKFCASCGAGLSGSEIFCPGCGSKTSAAIAALS